ncbi:MAG: NifU family protein [Actinobacteria bacterium]|nr:NifU family protein [Actinomycetota bacterium]
METLEPILRVTDEARAQVAGVRASENDPESLALWLEVVGQADGEYTYDMWFQATSDASTTDAVQHADDISIVIPAASVDKVRGATLDLSRDPAGGGMIIVNPNRPEPPAPPAGVPEADLSSELAQRVLAVLNEQINPAIASHGGRAELVAVDDDTAYLRLSGGCQGCGMAAVTLSQGIEVAIKDNVPEISRVVDVTDHASGENPYFEAAKK